MALLKSELYFSKLCVSLKSSEECFLPEFTGSLLRGAFGHALKNSFCISEDRKCPDCPDTEECGYFLIFESQDHSKKKLGYQYKPHPYIITPSTENKFRTGEILKFEITFFGKFSKLLSHFIPAFQEMGATGLGKDRKKFTLCSILDKIDDTYIYQDGKQLKNNLAETTIQKYAIENLSYTDSKKYGIEFITPARFAENGKVLKNISGKVLLDGMIRRYTSMHSFYGNLNREDTSIRNLEIKISVDKVSFKKWNRYSNRQERKVQQSGILGFYSVENPGHKLLEFLKSMEILHVGKNTSFGLGKILVENTE